LETILEELELIQERKREEEVEGFSDAENGDTSQQSVIDEKAKSQVARRNPPARNTSRFWFERFLAVIQRQNPTVIDSSFLSQIAPNNEGKLLAQLKFLRLIDDQGKPTALLPTLNMVGAEQKKGFQQIIRESYGDLLSEIVIERAVPDDVVNYFIRRYTFTRDKGINAAKFFLYLSEKGSLAVSKELSTFLTEKGTNGGASTTQSPQVIAPSVKLAPNERLMRSPLRESRAGYSSPQRRSQREVQAGSLQAVINVKLDKDTPKEYWDRVLALLGERRDTGENPASPVESSESQYLARVEGNHNPQ
jgi:hypothetical protein